MHSEPHNPEEVITMYGYKKNVSFGYEEAVTKVRESLQKRGFSVLTEINVKATLKKKLDINFDKYIILGACNPSLAYQTLQAEHEIGLMLPCNVIVYEREGNVTVSAILPTVAMAMIDNHRLKEIAAKVESKLVEVIDNL